MRDGNIGGALSRTTSSGTFYYHYDGNGNVVAMTNSSGTIVAEYTYDAYGNLTAMSGSEAADNPIRFSTKYFDSNTGYYDFGFRSYDPVTGRWLNRDPIGEEGGLNLYGFVGNSPGNVLDAYGLQPSSTTTPPNIPLAIELAKEGVVSGVAKSYITNSITMSTAAESRGGFVRRTVEWSQSINRSSPRHHIFPQALRADFTRCFGRDIIDNKTLQIPRDYHNFLHHSVRWNDQWKAFFRGFTNRNPTPKEVMAQARQMLREVGLGDVKWSETVRWKSPR